MAKTTSSAVKSYEGCNFLRQRLILSTLSGIPVRISGIRMHEDEPGIREFEASFLRLLDKLTNGTKIEVNETGTGILYIPGLLVGGNIDHDCSTERGLGYFLEAVIPLAPFCKKSINMTLRGVTNDPVDLSVDTIKYVTLALMKKFGIDEGLELKIRKRGAKPDGGGEVVFTCPVRRKLSPLHFTDSGKLKRIRGTAYSMKVSPAFANRIVDSSRGILNKVLSDIYIYTDHAKGETSGNSPGFGLSLMVESTTGVMLSAEKCSNPKGQGEAVVAEDLGQSVAVSLLQEVYRGGCVDSVHQSLVILYMALGQMDVSKVLLGELTPYTIQFLRHMKDFFNIMYKIELMKKDTEEESFRGSHEKYIVSCMGVGYTNLSKTSI
ncbi:RNA 3'-terminal phosphate cyclase-like protein [Hydractinia symbiolongicarpus]|uniref:RNA 3'-terminal phosphate cyclase-like protein n=1 Tax=Hydractinia symbiolongicarpus TaxID=13093 RepID=UPI00254C2660|nr:RNA 3'-terminal phosphate cyclase-like protein [Hydractinia symbiolongicarpus]